MKINQTVFLQIPLWPKSAGLWVVVGGDGDLKGFVNSFSRQQPRKQPINHFRMVLDKNNKKSQKFVMMPSVVRGHSVFSAWSQHYQLM